MSLRLVPLNLAEANALVSAWHRHHKPTPGCKFALGVAVDDDIFGCVIVGRPVSRRQDDGATLEVNRCCTNGERNACSFLYAAAWRATKALGYTRLITYTLPQEGGASLRGAGWTLIGERKSGHYWTSRPRIQASELLCGPKVAMAGRMTPECIYSIAIAFCTAIAVAALGYWAVRRLIK